jgi:hypothetical protein
MNAGSIGDIGGVTLGLSQSQFDALPASEKQARYAQSMNLYLGSSNGALIAIHELIHLSIDTQGRRAGSGDISLARAALSFTGQDLDLTKADDDRHAGIASKIWDGRLREACGAGRNVDDKYREYIKQELVCCRFSLFFSCSV